MHAGMPTSIHLPPDVLAWLDREATRQGITRNRVVTQIIVREMNARDDWSPNLFPVLVDSAMSEKKS
jgi:hypothetical protein